MAIKNQELYITYRAWNNTTNTGIAGDSANHSLYLIKDGIESLIANSIDDLGNGQYGVNLTADQMSADSITLRPVTTTSNVIIYSVLIITDSGLTKQILQQISSSSSSSS